MSDEELERIKKEKVKKLMMLQSIPREIIKIQSENQFNDISTKFKDKISVIDFWAVWCAPCISFAPVFEQLFREYQQDFIFAKVNVDEVPGIANRFQITGIPTTLFVKNGNPVHKMVGAANYQMMKVTLEKLKSNN